MKRFAIVIVTLTLLVVLALGILNHYTAPTSVEGRWAMDMNGEEVIWTFDAGKITFTYQNQPAATGGSYEYADGVLKLTLDEEWADYDTYNCRFGRNKMTLTQEGVEDKLVFTRVED